MNSMPKVIVYGMFSITLIIVSFSLLAEGFYTLMDAFDEIVAEQDLSSLTSFWNTASNTMRAAYFLVAVMLVIGIMLYVYLNAQKREYVTAGGYYP